MQLPTLHIVCLQTPYPPDFGGVMDLFWKLKYLKEAGINIILHCFDDGRGQQVELNQYCSEVNYYRRKTGWTALSLTTPYIVKSRTNKKLEARLLQDDYPILLEGTHCSAILNHPAFTRRSVYLRVHNIEVDYYKQLFYNSSLLLHKIYFYIESRHLQGYEPAVFYRSAMNICVSEKDASTLLQQFPRTIYLPVFLRWNAVEGLPGNGNYCLYHGNLSVNENEKAALWLLEQVFHQSSIPLVIAGKNPSATLRKAAEENPQCQLVENPCREDMDRLVREAHINILPSFSTTGIKLKLLHALFCGRHCLVNLNMVAGTGLAPLCSIANSASEFRIAIEQLFREKFTTESLQLRSTILLTTFNNKANAERLRDLIFKEASQFTDVSNTL